MPEKKVTTRTIVGNPGVRSTPKIFWITYHAPSRKLKNEKIKPSVDNSINGFEVKLNNPFRPIFIEPKNLL